MTPEISLPKEAKKIYSYDTLTEHMWFWFYKMLFCRQRNHLTLLQEGEYTKEEKLFKKKTDTFSGVYWCLTTAIYLAWSFWTMSWDITWIVWPVAGVLFAALLGVVKMVLKNGSETQHYI